LLGGTADCFVSLQWIDHWLWYGFKTSDRMYQKGNIYSCPAINHIYCKRHLNISHFMERSIFISRDTMGKLTVHFNILCLQLFDQRK
jgi:hypothetical protein